MHTPFTSNFWKWTHFPQQRWQFVALPNPKNNISYVFFPRFAQASIQSQTTNNLSSRFQDYGDFYLGALVCPRPLEVYYKGKIYTYMYVRNFQRILNASDTVYSNCHCSWAFWVGVFALLWIFRWPSTGLGFLIVLVFTWYRPWCLYYCPVCCVALRKLLRVQSVISVNGYYISVLWAYL